MLEKVLRWHAARYPLMEPRDVVKLLYQGEFGGGHLITDPQASLDRLRKELAATPAVPGPLAEDLGDGLARMQLGALKACGISPETANRLFVNSAGDVKGDPARFQKKLELARALSAQGLFAFDEAALTGYLEEYARAGCSPVSHSEAYRRAYHPAYRVVCGRILAYGPLLAAMDELLARQGRLAVAIDGRCASGKSTLGQALARLYPSNLFHMDDFFLQSGQRTAQRLAQPGGNVDYERFSEEVLQGLKAEKSFSYRPYRCSVGALGEPIAVSPRPVSVVEGSYSLHPALRGAYDLKVFLDIDPHVQSRRILRRNGPQMHQVFLERWIPLEEQYFSALHIKKHCDFIFAAQDES